MSVRKLINKPQLCITGLGLMTSVGHDAKTACASIRAGIKRPAKLENYYVNSEQGYDDWDDGLVTGHPVLAGNPDNTESRLFTLLCSALQDLYKDAGSDDSVIDNLPWYVSLPEGFRGKTSKERLEALLADNPENLRFSCKELVPFYQGNAGMIEALAHAAEAVANQGCERVVIAGADSLIGLDDLLLFNSACRLKTEPNPDGFIPGEAGAAFLVESTASAQKRKAAIGAVIDRICLDHENDNVLSGSKAPGNSLVNIISAMNPDKDYGIEPDTIVTDMNGESFRARELGNAHYCILDRIGGEKNMCYPAKSLGDTGAAYAGIAVAIAVRAMARGYIAQNKSNGNALILASSDSGARGAIYMTPTE